MNVDFWSKKEWLEHLRAKKIFVMTRQIFLNMLNTVVIPVEKVNLLIFDEAHHAAPKSKKKKASKKNKATKDCYKLIMDYIHSKPESHHPRILGLSASLVNANNSMDTLKDTIADLEKTYKSTCTSVTDLDEVRKYATDPEECILEYDSSANIGFECNQAIQVLKEVGSIFYAMDRYKYEHDEKNKDRKAELNVNEVSKNIIVDLPIGLVDFKKCNWIIIYILQSMGPWCAVEACDFYIQEFQKYIHLYENTYPEFGSMLTTVHNMMQTVDGLIKYNLHVHQVSIADMILKFTSEKMKRLLNLLLDYNNPNRNLAGIVFVEQRAICKVLCKWLQKLKEIDEQYEFLQTDYIVGEAVRPGFANKIAVKAAEQQRETLNKFRRSDINLLIATSILEEGLDVSQCNLVVRYDGVNTYRQWVQSQGRARSKEGKFVIFTESASETKQKSDDFKAVAKKLQLECQSVKRTYRPSTSIGEILPVDEMPLIHPVTLARVTLDTAKTIVFMYCNRLPSDAFFSTNPCEIIKESENGYQCKIRLPINSSYKSEIEGPVKQTESKAIKAAYLKACSILSEQDEIDEHFVPYSKKARLKKIIEEFNLSCSIEGDDEEYLSDGPKPGTVKRRQTYFKAFEKMFTNLPIEASAANCLYAINIEPKSGVKSIGFICSEYVPINNIVASFPVYIKTTEFKISVTTINTKFNLNRHQLHQVHLFHQVVFYESLRFKKTELQFNEKTPVLIVPLNDNFGIDFEMIQLSLERREYNMTTNHDEKRKHFEFNENDYNDAIVYRWYDPVGLFKVLKVESKTPSSQFPQNNEGYTNYVDYYFEKYNLKVIHTSCPLLKVDSIGVASSVNRVEQTKAERKRKPIDLVPELLLISPIPASFHSQCRLLPAIFYRLCQVYNVECLRKRIASEGSFGWKALPSNHNWGALNFDSNKSIDRNNVSKRMKMDHIVGSNFGTEYDRDDNEPSILADQDTSETEEMESSTELSSDTLTKKLSSLEIYGDVNELKRQYANFDVNAYTSNIKTKMFEQFEKLLQAPLITFDCDNHSQYLPKSSAIPKKFYVDFDRVKSFDIHTDNENMIGPSPCLLLQALTTRNAVDMFNMERLETLGDSFLKLTTSAYFHYKLPVLNEGYLSLLKVNQISNYNLYRLGTKKHLAEYIIAHQFQPSNRWLPPGFCVNNDYGSMASSDQVDVGDQFTKQNISDKSIADCCEALIGAYLLSSGPKGAVEFMSWLGIRIVDPMVIDNNGHWLQSPRSGQASSGIDSEIKIKNLASTLTRFEENIGYDFRDKCFLIQAMTHVSYHDNTVTDCYQRLEFLGDAVLDYLITRYIYQDPKQFAPGDLTALRAALTNNSIFGSLAVKHNFHVHLKMNSYELYRSIHSFADKFKENQPDVVYGNFMLLLDERDSKNLEEIDVPKALGDVFEAVAGAIYLDSNYSLDAVWRVYYPLMKTEFGKKNSLKTLRKKFKIIIFFLFSDEFSQNIPKSPLSLLYMKFPKSVIFSKAVIMSSDEVSVTVTIKHKSGTFSEDGFGKNRYWAKNSAAKRVLRRKCNETVS